MHKLKNGDAGSQTAFYERFRGSVFSFVKDRSRTIEDAEEITNDVFIRAYKSIANYEPHASMKTWLFKLAENATLDFYKSPANQYGGYEFHDDMLPKHMLNLKDDYGLRESINDLPSRYREALEGQMSGKGSAEQATEMDTTDCNVRKLRQRARDKIKDDYFG